jgi:dTDP-4-dehydrorhamnose reductase
VLPSSFSQSEPVILVTGANSKLAEALARVFRTHGRKNVVFASSRPQTAVYYDYPTISLDITVRKDVKEVCLQWRPDFIINTAAYTNVDKAETERQASWTVNVSAVEHLLYGSRVIDAHFIHFSTDYIFDGESGPYTEEAQPRPLGYYARTKLASENICIGSNVHHTIIRTNVLYGATKLLKTDFVLWVLNKLAEGLPFSVVNDQFSNPTLLDDLAYMVERVIQTRKAGIFHSGGADWINRFQFAQKIAEVFKLQSEIMTPVSTAELQQTAPRPLKGGLIPFKAETALGIKFCGIESGLTTMRRQLQMMGHRRWML